MSYSNPHLQISDSTNQAIAVANTPQAVTFDTDEFKRKMSHSTSTNPSRIYVNEAGRYNASCLMHITSTGANKVLDMWIRVNGADVARTNVNTTLVNTNDSKTVSMEFCFDMTAGQYMEVIMSGDSTNLSLIAQGTAVSPTRPASPSALLTIMKI